MAKKVVLFVLAAVMFFNPSQVVFAGAEEDLLFMDVTPFVTTASKKAESIDMAPNVMYVYTKEDIKRRGYRSVRDVLNNTPGFGTFINGYNYYFAQVRGIAGDSNERLAIMVNGHILEGVHLLNFLTGVLNLDNVERIEIIVGPGSVLYGAKTVAGIVNLITKKQEGSELIVTAGNNNDFSASIVSGKKLNDTDYVTGSLTMLNQGGWDPFFQRALTNGRRADFINGKNASPMIFGQAEIGGLWMQGISLHEQTETNFTPSLNSEASKTYQWLDSFSMKQTDKMTDNLESSLSVGIDTKRWGTITQGTASIWDLSQITYNFEYAIQHKMEKNFFQAGLQYEYNVNKQNYNLTSYDKDKVGSSTTSYVTTAVKPIDTKAVGAYLSDDFQVSDTFKIVGAVRADRDTKLSEDKYYISPRAALIYSPEKELVVKLMYNTATRYPLPFESQLNNIWGKDNPGASGNLFSDNYLTSKPEQLTATELQGIYYIGKTRLSMNVYQQVLKDFMAFGVPFTNVGDFNGTGIEFSGKTPINSALGVWYSATYSKNKFTETCLPHNNYANWTLPVNPDGYTAAVPEYTANVGAEYNLSKKFTVTSGVRYFTKQLAVVDSVTVGTWPFSTTTYTWDYINNRAYLDAGITWKALESLDLRLSGQNVGNNTDMVAQQYNYSLYYPQGATYQVTAYYRF